MKHNAAGRASPSRARYFWLAACPVAAGATAIALSVFSGTAGAATAVGLGTAGSYAVLAGSTITNTGSSVLTGDLGLSPGTAVTGFPPGIYTGSENVANPAAVQAQLDLTTAYNTAAAEPTTTTVTTIGSAGSDKAALIPGVYTASTALEVEGALTLNAEGDPDATWIFKAGSTLKTTSFSHVIFVNDPAPAADQACNVYWQVGSSATIQTFSHFSGTILAYTSITVLTGAVISGRALASNGAVTLDDDTITTPGCDTTTPPSPTATPTTTASPTTTPTTPPTTPPPSPTTPPTTTTTTPPPSPTSPPTSPTSSSAHPAPSPTGLPTSTGPRPAPIPTPVPTTFPVTG